MRQSSRNASSFAWYTLTILLTGVVAVAALDLAQHGGMISSAAESALRFGGYRNTTRAGCMVDYDSDVFHRLIPYKEAYR